jgi:hypothetical protein
LQFFVLELRIAAANDNKMARCTRTFFLFSKKENVCLQCCVVAQKSDSAHNNSALTTSMKPRLAASGFCGCSRNFGNNSHDSQAKQSGFLRKINLTHAD